MDENVLVPQGQEDRIFFQGFITVGFPADFELGAPDFEIHRPTWPQQ